MKFSIIMPTFNRRKFILNAVNAILNQDYDDWELIIQNGGESISDIIQSDSRIRLYEEKDSGITDAMNRGMRKATGDIFNWSNDDDMMAPGTLKYVSENIKDNEWMYGTIEMVGTDGLVKSTMGYKTDFGGLIEDNAVPQPSVFWTRKAYEVIGDMDESIDLTSDYDYWIRLMKNFEPLFTKRVMAHYLLHPEQITNTRSNEQLNQSKITKDKYGNKTI